MKKPKSIFYFIYFLFHFGLLITAIYTNYRSEDFEFLLWLRDRMDWMIYAAVLGLVLFIVNIVMVTMANRQTKKEVERLEHEANSFKAKMFDLQEATKGDTFTKNTPAPGNAATD